MFIASFLPELQAARVKKTIPIISFVIYLRAVIGYVSSYRYLLTYGFVRPSTTDANKFNGCNFIRIKTHFIQ